MSRMKPDETIFYDVGGWMLCTVWSLYWSDHSLSAKLRRVSDAHLTKSRAIVAVHFLPIVYTVVLCVW